MMQKCYPQKSIEKKPCKCEEKDNYKCEENNKCKEEKCCRKCDEAGRAMLKCVTGNSIANAFSVEVSGVATPQPYFLGSITVDDSNLCNASTLLNFSAVLSNLAGGSVTGTSTVNVYRDCKGTRRLITSVPVSGAIDPFGTNAISFQVCADTDCCTDCVTYSFEFVPPAVPLGITTGLTITNVVISALTVEKNC